MNDSIVGAWTPIFWFHTEHGANLFYFSKTTRLDTTHVHCFSFRYFFNLCSWKIRTCAVLNSVFSITIKNTVRLLIFIFKYICRWKCLTLLDVIVAMCWGLISSAAGTVMRNSKTSSGFCEVHPNSLANRIAFSFGFRW